jgi:hypothetical protein
MNGKKLLMAAAGAGGEGLNVEDVFHTQVYTGTNANQQVTNNIDLSTEGGLLWFKSRSNIDNYRLINTERGLTKSLSSHLAAQETIYNASFPWLVSFNTDGYTIGNQNDTNFSGYKYVGWTFRKAPKFFDIVTWTGNGVNGRSISHSLNSLVGMITVKCTSTNGTNWSTWHRGASGTLWLNSTNADSANGGGQATSGFVYNPGSNTSAFTVDNGANVNQSGREYVAYLWAHNNNDGGFGLTSDQDIIKCGSYQSDGAASEIDVNLGFEPQFVMAKAVSTTGNWHVQDVQRGMAIASSTNPYLQWNTSDYESADGTAGGIVPLNNGFRVGLMGDINIFNAQQTYIYMAIRRGPMAVPTSATDVFAVDDVSNGAFEPDSISGFPVDFVLRRYINTTNNWVVCDRLRGHYHLKTNSTDAEAALNSSTTKFDYMNGVNNIFSTNNTNFYHWMWKRAPGYFDVVAYTGTGSTRTVAHNLGAAPEMMWFKGRNQSAYNWMVYHKNISPANGIYLSDSGAASGASFQFANTAPTATVFTVGSGVDVNSSNEPYIAYLFATAPGVSKVGSFTGTAATQTIDCGFSSGARFVLIKETNTTGGWMVFDTERGIVSGNDARLELDDTGAESTASDILDPHSSGFQLPSSSFVNASGRECIFYAIA